jgi:RpiB/LacA/LacB family sugar-phosphate isomerase
MHHVAIRQLGAHRGKPLIFGFDRSVLRELDAYVQMLSRYGIALPAVHHDDPGHLTSAQRVCERVQSRGDAVGVLICATGMGSAIAANKFRGVYAARCVSVEDARVARATLNANVLCLSAAVGVEENARIVDAFMCTPYAGERQDELEYVTCMELESDPAPRAKTG